MNAKSTATTNITAREQALLKILERSYKTLKNLAKWELAEKPINLEYWTEKGEPGYDTLKLLKRTIKEYQAKSKLEETEKSHTDGLNDQQIAVYLHGGGAGCPRCQSDNIGTTDSLECEGAAGDATQQIECSECGLSWRDVYHLVGIEISL